MQIPLNEFACKFQGINGPKSNN